MKRPGIAASSQQALDQFKPWRDRSVPKMSVPCPTCGAAVGAPCTSASGKDLNAGHRDRRRQALKEQASGDPS